MATISNSNSNTLVVGTAEADSIENQGGSYVTIDAAAGNDTINNKYRNYDNNIYRNNSGDSITINAGDGDDLIYNLNFDVAINAGDGNDSIDNAKESATVTINGGVGDDSIHNVAESVTINSGAGNDSISNSNSNVTINAGDGNDDISNWYGSNVTIDGGDGNDDIPNWYGSNVTIDGGAGNDDIYTISDGAYTYIYNEGDGHDTISSSTPVYNADVITTWNYNYSNNFSLQINSASPWSSVVSGNNIVITVGDGSITLVDAATSSGVNINGVTYPIDNNGTGTDNTDTDNNVTDNGGTDNGVTDNNVTDNSVTDNNVTDNNVTDNGGTDTPVTLPPDTPVTPETLPPAVGGAAYDIVFFVDVSDSMETYIDRVNAIAQTFVDKLTERGITNYRLAVVDYETAPNVYFGADGSPFTQDVDTFKSWLAQAASKSSSTGGANENALYAINHVLNNFQFNPTANKEFIVLTDEDFDANFSNENFGGNIFDLATTEQLMAANGVQLDVIGLPTEKAQELGYGYHYSIMNCEPAWTPVARNTGGNFYDINGNYTETFNEIVLNLDCVNVNLATVPDGQTGWFFVVPGNHVTDLKSVDAIFVNANDPNLEAYTQLYGQPVGAVTADKVYSGTMSAYRQKITIPDMWNVTATSHADILNVAGTGFGVVIASGDGHDAVKLGDAATGIILTDHSLDDDGLEFARRQTLGTFTENVATDPVTMTNQVALTSPTMAVYLQNFSSPLQEEFDAKNAQFMAYGVTNGGTTNTVYDLLFGTEPVPEPEPEPIAPPQPPILNDTLMGRIMFAQWGYGFTPPPTNPLYDATTDATTETTASTIATDSLATSADLAVDFGSPSLDEIAPVNFAVTQDDFTAKNFTSAAFMQAYELSAASKPKFS